MILRRVKTPLGRGLVIKSENQIGILNQQFLVRLDNCPNEFQELHDNQDGLYFFQNELELIQ